MSTSMPLRCIFKEFFMLFISDIFHVSRSFIKFSDFFHVHEMRMCAVIIKKKLCNFFSIARFFSGGVNQSHLPSRAIRLSYWIDILIYSTSSVEITNKSALSGTRVNIRAPKSLIVASFRLNVELQQITIYFLFFYLFISSSFVRHSIW